jgi:hypothetical protein
VPAIKGSKQNGRSSDVTFSWLTAERGAQWEDWRTLIACWLAIQHQGFSDKMQSLSYFSIYYLTRIPGGYSPAKFFELAQRNSLPNLLEIISERNKPKRAAKMHNYITDFVGWVIANNFSEPDDKGNAIPLFANPFEKTTKTRLNDTETVYNPLPYAFIKELRQILCPKPFGNFKDWTWAQYASGNARPNSITTLRGFDWFEVDSSLIDESDPDCVWRTRTVFRNNKKSEIYELWSPVHSVAVLVKLHLPLRTYQVRFLDSGEADTWRYQKGNWVLNDRHPFKNGSEKNTWNRGVFCRIRSVDVGEIMTGLYINTNKTADQNKDERSRGYTIPWQHEEMLYWLEKLRNWQEKYNPIIQPTHCAELENKHFNLAKSEQQKREMGSICFLFRDSSAKGDNRRKPIPTMTLSKLWFYILAELECRVAARGQALSDGSKLRFVQEYPDDYFGSKVATGFPLHSLRVSLLTCYAMEGQVPMPVLSKLLAGHSRLLMTLY